MVALCAKCRHSVAGLNGIQVWGSSIDMLLRGELGNDDSGFSIALLVGVTSSCTLLILSVESCSL
jgi:hypothetical protein